MKIGLDVKVMIIINIKADDIFIGNISADVISSKVDSLISNFSPKAPTKLRPSSDATLIIILRFKIYDTKRWKTKKERSFKLEGLCNKIFVYVFSPGYVKFFSREALFNWHFLTLHPLLFCWHWPDSVTTSNRKKVNSFE